ncbi:hypothetical protein [Aliikangiella sp. IMCC44632]
MKLRTLFSILVICIIGNTQAGDILTTNKSLYDKANSGDVKSMEILSRFYFNQYSFRYNPEHSRYWQCRIEKVRPSKESKLDCPSLLAIGAEKKYDVFFERGQEVKKVVLSSNARDNLKLEVPAERDWLIKWKRSDCDGVCSYELAIDGYYYVGPQKKYLIGRESTISLSGSDDGEILVSSGSIVTLQVASDSVEIVEYAQ